MAGRQAESGVCSCLCVPWTAVDSRLVQKRWDITGRIPRLRSPPPHAIWLPHRQRWYCVLASMCVSTPPPTPAPRLILRSSRTMSCELPFEKPAAGSCPQRPFSWRASPGPPPGPLPFEHPVSRGIAVSMRPPAVSPPSEHRGSARSKPGWAARRQQDHVTVIAASWGHCLGCSHAALLLPLPLPPPPRSRL